MKNRCLNRLFNFFAFAALLLQTALPVSANMAAPTQGGSTTGEPYGLKDIYITREFLTIDFRPFAATANGVRVSNAKIEAIYEVENKGVEKTLTLLFAAGFGNVENFKISIDGREVEKTEIETDDLPQTWQSPNETPWKDGRKLMYSPPESLNKAIKFELTIPAGNHKIVADYEAEAAVFADLEPLKAWQLAYILAPAKEWAGFGELNVKVFVPENWEIVTAPELKREGGILSGKFNEIPADSLAMTIRPPLPANYETTRQISDALFMTVLIGCPVLLLIFALFYGYKTNRRWLYAISFGILWGILIFATGYFSFYAANHTIPEAQFSSYGYGNAFNFIFLLIITVAAPLVGAGLYLLSTFLKRKFSKDDV